jgi:hypothetical protein
LPRDLHGSRIQVRGFSPSFPSFFDIVLQEQMHVMNMGFSSRKTLVSGIQEHRKAFVTETILECLTDAHNAQASM